MQYLLLHRDTGLLGLNYKQPLILLISYVSFLLLNRLQFYGVGFQRVSCENPMLIHLWVRSVEIRRVELYWSKGEEMRSF